MLKPAVLPVIALLSLLPVARQTFAQCDALLADSDTVTGLVYEDLNLNSRHDSATEPGISQVSVSNGCDVVLTDVNGAYEIPLAPLQILFISQPSGFVVPVDQNNQPQFFYRYYPQGSPAIVAGTAVEWMWPVIEPSGPLPARIDFPLHRLSDRETRFSAYGFADPQAPTELEEDMLREDLINTLLGNPHGARFSITVGDVVFDNLALYDRHKEMIGSIGVPQWNLPGNHDINFESPNAYLANETYKRHFGPVYYSFNYGNAHIVALNNVEYAGAGRTHADNERYRGFISEDQLRWLEQDLSHVPADKLIVIATHISLVAEAASTDPTVKISGPRTENFDRLLALLEPFNNIYGLAGHDTSNSWKTEVNHSHGWTGRPWLAHTLAEVRGSGWNSGPRDLRGVADAMMQDGNPNGYYVLKFDDVVLTPEFIPFPFGPEAGQRLRIVLEPALVDPDGDSLNRGVQQPGTKVVVNLFDGGERDEVNMLLDDGTPLPMRYVIRTDPLMEKIYAQYADTEQAFASPAPSSHLWELELPDNLDPGLHSLVVETEDEFGQRQRRALTFEIE